MEKASNDKKEDSLSTVRVRVHHHISPLFVFAFVFVLALASGLSPSSELGCSRISRLRLCSSCASYSCRLSHPSPSSHLPVPVDLFQAQALVKIGFTLDFPAFYSACALPIVEYDSTERTYSEDDSWRGLQPRRSCSEYLTARKGSSGSIPAAISSLKSLTGLYLHFNSLSGILPKEISSLTHLTDLCLNVNSLSGDIPRQIANLSNLQVITSQIRQTAEYFSDLIVLLDLSSENEKIWWSNFDNKTSS
nr:receptor-like protein 43 [Arachis hypogaea]